MTPTCTARDAIIPFLAANPVASLFAVACWPPRPSRRRAVVAAAGAPRAGAARLRFLQGDRRQDPLHGGLAQGQPRLRAGAPRYSQEHTRATARDAHAQLAGTLAHASACARTHTHIRSLDLGPRGVDTCTLRARVRVAC
eukprot:1141931-Pleurochrysis_carterae.AAC.3